jgi:alpha-L-fucosidase
VALERLREIGDWMQVNGEAIFETRAVAPYSEGEVQFTRKGSTVHAFLMDDSVDVIRSFSPKSVRLLGSDVAVEWSPVGLGFRFAMPESALPSPHVLAIEV